MIMMMMMMMIITIILIIMLLTGDWMFIVNMNDQPQFQQLVRSEVCM